VLPIICRIFCISKVLGLCVSWFGYALSQKVGFRSHSSKGATMENNKHEKSLSLWSVFHLCYWHFALAILTTIVLSGCGSGGGEGGEGTNQQSVATQADVIIAAVNDDSDLLAVAIDRYGNERIGISGEKDLTGNPVKLTTVNYFSSGIAGTLEIGSDGLPLSLSDRVGNKFVFANYTSTTVEVTFIDYEGNQISGPHVIPVDAAKLTEIRSIYAAGLQGYVASQDLVSGVQATSVEEDAARIENTKRWLRRGIHAVGIAACAGSLVKFAPVALAEPDLFLLAAAGCLSEASGLIQSISGTSSMVSDGSAKIVDLASCTSGDLIDCWLLVADPLVNYERFDIFAPSVPSGVVPRDISHNRIVVRWEESHDTYGIAGYIIYRDEVEHAHTRAIEFTDLWEVSPGSHYCYRVQARDVGGNNSEKSDPLCVTTKIAPTPIAVTGMATNITSSSSALNGTVNPNGLATDVFFQYGTLTPYQSETPRQPIGNSTAFVSVPPLTINGLVPGATYHYRIVAVNSEGSANYGTDQTFRAVTPLVPEPIITGVSPDPVPGSNNVQLFTINGSNFVSGANVTLRDKSTGEVFPYRVASSFSSTQIVIKPIFTTVAATWSVNVVNPDGMSTGEHVFQVVAPSTHTPFCDLLHHTGHAAGERGQRCGDVHGGAIERRGGADGLHQHNPDTGLCQHKRG
jgi:hypothetical protein